VNEGIKGIRKQTRDGATKEGITEEQEQRRQQAWTLLKVIAFDWEKEVSRRSQYSWRHIYTLWVSASRRSQVSNLRDPCSTRLAPPSRIHPDFKINHQINSLNTLKTIILQQPVLRLLWQSSGHIFHWNRFSCFESVRPSRAALQISQSVQPLHPRVQLHAEQLMFDMFLCGILYGYIDACTPQDDQARPSFIRMLPLTSFGSIRCESVSALIGLNDVVDTQEKVTINYAA
jgi:hypothetical protein